MAKLIDPTELFYTSFQPKLGHQYILYVDGIPSFMIRSVTKPQYQANIIELPHINLTRKIKGKSTWSEMQMTLYNPIEPSGAQIVMEWIRLGHEPATGRDGYADFYKKDLVINGLGPVGEVVEEWIIKGAFITGANFGQLSWESDTPVDIELDIAYDRAILNF